MITKFNSFTNEAIDQDFLVNNPNFYLSYKKDNQYLDDEKKADEFYKKLDYRDMECEKIENDDNYLKIKGLNVKVAIKDDVIHLFMRRFFAKVIFYLMFIKLKGRESYKFVCPYNLHQFINEIFSQIQYYGLYYFNPVMGYILFLTKDSKEYIEEIKHCKEDDIKITYYNNNVKGGREFFDIVEIKGSRTAEMFRKATYDDMYYEKVEGTNMLQLRFKKPEMDEFFGKYKFIFHLANDVQMENNLFGKKVGHRYHIGGNGLPPRLKGLGLGYKAYKKLIYTVGYICSNSSLSHAARSLYSKLVKDPDFYTVVVTSTHPMLNKVLIIDKNFKQIPELMKLVQEQEKLDLKKDKKFNTKYTYDKELTPYLSIFKK